MRGAGSYWAPPSCLQYRTSKRLTSFLEASYRSSSSGSAPGSECKVKAEICSAFRSGDRLGGQEGVHGICEVLHDVCIQRGEQRWSRGKDLGGEAAASRLTLILSCSWT